MAPNGPIWTPPDGPIQLVVGEISPNGVEIGSPDPRFGVPNPGFGPKWANLTPFWTPF